MIDLIDVRKVYARRGAEPVIALDGINLTIPSGDIHGIVGESGAGKSTLIRCLTALERPTEGRILVDGDDLTRLSPRELRNARRRIGMVFQGGNLLDSRTAAQNIALPLQIGPEVRRNRSDVHGRVSELLRVVGLEGRASSYPSQLSGGQRQRVGIARALADNPSVLLCDEPTSALDSETTDQILDLLKSVRASFGVTVLVITHEMGVVRRICDSVTLLERGKIAATGAVSDVVADTASALSRRVVPKPYMDPDASRGSAIVDIAFTSSPGEPTGSRVLGLAAEFGADIATGSFETIGSTQVARLALTVDPAHAQRIARSFAAAGVNAEVRA